MLGAARRMTGPRVGALVATAVIMVAPGTTSFSPGLLGYSLSLCAFTIITVVGSASQPLEELLDSTLPLAVVIGWSALMAWAAVTMLWSTNIRVTTTTAVMLAVVTCLAAWVTLARDWSTALDTVRSVVVVTLTGSALLGVSAALSGGMRFPLPLGAASASPVPLLLCIGVALPACLDRTRTRASRLGWCLMTAVALMLLLATASRVGYFGLAALMAVVVLRLSWSHVRDWALPIALGSAALGALILGLVLRSARSVSLTDPVRSENLRSGIDAWTSEPWRVVLGTGYGEVWPWLASEVGWGPGPSGAFVFTGPYGGVLWQPHSTLFALLVETGVVGLLLLTAFAVAVSVVLRKGWSSPDPRIWMLAAAVIAGLPGFVVETQLLRGFPAAWVWWLAVLALAAECGGSRFSARESSSGTPS